MQLFISKQFSLYPIIVIISNLYSANYRKKNIGATVKIKNKNYLVL